MSEITWPEVFTNPDFVYDETEPGIKAYACAEGLCAWANCEAGIGREVPKYFGQGMVKIGIVLGISATGDNLMTYAQKLKPKEIT